MSGFKELGIADDFVKGLSEIGITVPTSIQKEVIPALIDNDGDLIGQAQTGTGKTAAFGLPLLHKIRPEQKQVQALVLSPTRELGQQISKQLFKFTKYSNKIFSEAVYGGEKIDKQISRLTRPTHVIVATPGRLIDLIQRKAVHLDAVRIVVLDEADEMLSMGFKKELDEILSKLSSVKNKWLFSATMPHGVKEIANKFLSTEAKRIEVSKDNIVNKNIEHQYVVCEEVDKLNIITQFLKTQKGNRGLVFCRTKAATEKLAKQLQAKNFAVDGIQGDMQQKERDKVMRAFKNDTIHTLVATDLAARGIDVPDLAYVVHYQLPDKDEYFTHRSGRTARAGKKGISLVLATTHELRNVRFYEKSLGLVFKQVR
ncbi:MAG: DEAD/DEAH box helicase [Flavobacteriales bacterium]|jgi:ATP-dependent RNA helicase DeaD|nr:DEAD/DEAH box helicase [Flavobacteriales bacterium]